MPPKTKREPNEWIKALKQWNTGKSMWCVPKKGTKEYDEILKLKKPSTKKNPVVKRLNSSYNKNISAFRVSGLDKLTLTKKKNLKKRVDKFINLAVKNNYDPARIREAQRLENKIKKMIA